MTEINATAIPGRIFKRESNDENQLGLSIIGKIKIGRKNDKNLPESIDYFRATGNYSESFHKALGEKPKKLTIAFPSDEAALCCYQRLEGRLSDGNLAAVSDGINHQLWNDKEQKYLPATEDELKTAKNKGIPVTSGYGQNITTTNMPVMRWVERLTLRFIVLEMKGILGVWELSTNGVASSIPNIIGNYDRMATAAGNKMNLVTFDLSVSFAKGQKPGSMSRYPVLNLVPNLSYESAMLLNEFKNSDQEYNKLITDDTIGGLLLNKGEMPETAFLPSSTVTRIPEQDQKSDPVNEPKPAVIKSGKTAKEQPFDPETFRKWIKDGKTEAAIDAKTLEKLDTALVAITDFSKKDISIFMEYLCGHQDLTVVSQGEAERIIKWIDPVEDQHGDVATRNPKRTAQYKIIKDRIKQAEGKLL